MIDIMIAKKDPKMEAQKFLEYVGSKDLSKMDKAIDEELSMIVKKVKENMDKPEMIMPLVMKGKMLCEKAEMEMENNGEDMSEDEGANDMSEDMSEDVPVKEYNAMDALNEIRAIVSKVKED